MNVPFKANYPKGIAMIFLFLLPIVLINSCRYKDNDTKSQPKSIAKASLKNRIPVNKPDTILSSTIGYVDGHQFIVTCNSKYNLFVTNEKGDHIYVDSVYSPNQKFIDFNGDGYKDILIDYVTNTPGIRDLLLYDKGVKSFKQVVDFQNFPEAKRIGKTAYYYSYHRSGCADLNWDSDLFYIKDDQTIRIGNISGRQCGDTGLKDGIYIFKTLADVKTQIDHLPINTIKRYKGLKWEFIDQYWRKNYKRFL